MHSTLPDKDVVLLGIGHTNAHVLRMWRMQPIRKARLTCISDFSVATYSGMLPGVLATQYLPYRMEIDLVRLCAAAGARCIQAEVSGLDVESRRIFFHDRPPIPFDVLSIGIGSVPTFERVTQHDDTVLPIKPMQTFVARLNAKLHEVAAKLHGRPLRIAVVGGGAGGVEISFCLPAYVRTILPAVPLEQSLINASQQLVGGALKSTSEKVVGELQSRGVKLLMNRRVVRACCGKIQLDDGQQLDADIVLWATSATVPPLLANLNLPRDERGFLATRSTLQTTADAPIFAVGDTGTILGDPTPKAGVYAVRQGPILWENIQRTLSGQPLIEYKPQRNFLKLLNTGDGRAIGEYLGVTLHNRWMWNLKDYIDSKFMRMYQDYSPMPTSMSVPDEDERSAFAMRCTGCGGKVAGSVLSRVLARLDIPLSENVVLGLDRPDDAAIIRPTQGRPLTLTVDFFAAPLDDPYLVGRIAALNAASDLFAMGAKPQAALAMVTLPVGKASQQEELLFQLLAGSLEEFRKMGATLVGGHTIEGPQLAIGFTMIGDQGDRPPRTKDRLRTGDVLLLTKPLGTGVLLAAHMRAQCRAVWMQTLLDSMLASNQPAAELLDEFDIAAVTDVTGFGLAGHLLEMLQASRLSAQLQLDQIPLLPDVDCLFEAGLESTLAPANRTAEDQIEAPESSRALPHYRALFDPQTSGGLLIAAPVHRAEEFRQRLPSRGVAAAKIGTIIDDDRAHIRIQ